MTNEDLLRPRYKTIADYPNSFSSAGEVLELKNHGGYWRYEYYDHDGLYTMSESELQEYPHLFKKLEWWERRKVEDLPEYLRCSKTIGKVKEYGWFKGGNSAKFEDGTTEYLSHCEPATKEEYEAYQSKK